MDYGRGRFTALALDNDLRPRSYAGQHRSKVAYRFLFRDVDYRVSHATIITDRGQLLTPRGIPNEFHIYPGRHDPQFVIRHFGDVVQFQWKAIGATKQ